MSISHNMYVNDVAIGQCHSSLWPGLRTRCPKSSREIGHHSPVIQAILEARTEVNRGGKNPVMIG